MAHVLGQYLEYLELLEELNIDTAGEFLLMAAELTHIKSRLLVHQPGEDEEEGGDPRAELVARLLEYQKYKRAATWLHKNPMLNRDFYIRPEVIGEAHTEEAPVVFEAGSVDPFGLIRAFQEILKKIPKDKAHAIETERVSVTDRIYEIVDRLKQKETIAFTELFEAMSSRLQLVVTFLALLEMAKLKMIHIQQMEENREIWISRKMTIDEGLGKLHVTVDAKEEVVGIDI